MDSTYENTNTGVTEQTAPVTTEQLKAKYGTIYQMSMTVNPDDDTDVDLDYVFKRPSTASYDRYIKTAASGMTKASRAFLIDNIVEEHKDKLIADLEIYPALPLTASEKLLAMLGMAKTANLTKL